MTRLPVKQDVQAVRRRRLPAVGVGADVRGAGPERRARVAATFATRCGRPVVHAAVARDDCLQPRAGALSHRRDDGVAQGGAKPSLSSGRRRSRRLSTAGSGTRAGPTNTRKSSALEPCGGRRTSNFTIPEPTGVVGIVAPDEPALDGIARQLAPVIVGGNTAVVWRRKPAAGGDRAGRGGRHRRSRRSEDLTGFKPSPRAVARRPHGRERDRCRRRRQGDPARTPGGRERQAGCPRAGRPAEPVRDRSVPGAEDRVATRSASEPPLYLDQVAPPPPRCDRSAAARTNVSRSAETVKMPGVTPRT